MKESDSLESFWFSSLNAAVSGRAHVLVAVLASSSGDAGHRSSLSAVLERLAAAVNCATVQNLSHCG